MRPIVVLIQAPDFQMFQDIREQLGIKPTVWVEEMPYMVEVPIEVSWERIT